MNVTNDKAKKHIRESRTQLVRTTIQQLENKKILKELPGTIDEVLNATTDEPIHWYPELRTNEAQCEESRMEQISIIQEMNEWLDKYQLAQDTQTKNPVISGGPGNGKMTVLQTGVLMSLCCGLNTGLTANMSERAHQLGCEHLSRMCCIPVNEKASPCRLAELAILRLLRNPMRLAYLRKLDVLFIDELGQILAELLSILDIILWSIHESTAYMGGVLVMATLDATQLPPVNG